MLYLSIRVVQPAGKVRADLSADRAFELCNRDLVSTRALASQPE